jgi:hypothetical protein
LKKLNTHRNHAAHTAYFLTIEEQEDSERMNELSQKMAEVTKVVKACIKELVREHSRVTNESVPEGLLDQI